MSTHDSASRKHSHKWNSGHLSRSGYQEHTNQNGEPDIQLSYHDSKHQNVNTVSGGGSSPDGSTIELNNDWEQNKGDWPANAGAADHKGIVKTVKITQL